MSMKEEENVKTEEICETAVSTEEVCEVNKKDQIKTIAKKGLKIAGVIGVGVFGFILGKISGKKVDTDVSDVIESQIVDE